MQVHLRGAELPFEHPEEWSSVHREVAGLLGAQVYPGKQLAPFADNQPMAVTSLLLSAATCHLKDPDINSRSSLSAHNALHLAVAAIVLQPRYGQAYHRTAHALSRLGVESGLQAAYAIMRYAAQLEGRPAAELLAELPPLPFGVVELPLGGLTNGALKEVGTWMFMWPLLMQTRTPRGQDFLLQLPGGLGELSSPLVHRQVAACDAEMQVVAALMAKARGNTAFIARRDTAGALREYLAAIDHLRALAATHLIRNCEAASPELLAAGCQALDPNVPQDPATAVAIVRRVLAPLVRDVLFPYQGQGRCALYRETATIFLKDYPPLPPIRRLPGCPDLPSLAGCFWSQLIAKFMEPVGGAEGLLASEFVWSHHAATMHVTQGFKPFD